MEKHLGKISRFRIGTGGYQDAQFGLNFQFSFAGSSAIGDFKGSWARYPESGAQYSREDFERAHAETYAFLRQIMADAKVEDSSQLVGIPVEITLDGMRLGSWRILTEVL